MAIHVIPVDLSCTAVTIIIFIAIHTAHAIGIHHPILIMFMPHSVHHHIPATITQRIEPSSSPSSLSSSSLYLLSLHPSSTRNRNMNNRLKSSARATSRPGKRMGNIKKRMGEVWNVLWTAGNTVIETIEPMMELKLAYRSPEE